MSSSKLNFLVHLHEPARELLLCSLDAGTLSACCCVCKSWNDIVNSSEDAWKNACQKLGLVMEDEDTRDASYWKGYALSIIERKMRMKKSTCFTEGPFNIESKDIKAVSNWDGNRIAVAFSNKIEIWKCKEKEWELNYRDRFETVSLMLQKEVLLVGNSGGLILSWRILAQQVLATYIGTRSSLTSFDCLTDHNIVAGSYMDSCIIVWNFLTGEMVKKIYHRNFMIVKVMLAHRTPEEASQQTQVFLFSVDVESICLRILNFNPSNITNGNVEVRQISIIPLDPPLRMPNTFILIGSLLFDGQYLYYPKSSPRVQGNRIGVWDVYNDEVFEEIIMEDEVKGLLAIGNKYMAIHTKDRNGGREKLCITKKFLNTEVAFCVLPRDIQRLGTFDSHYLIIGEKSWLDGLDGKNDGGLLYACVVDDEGLRTTIWTRRVVKAF